MGNRYPGAFFGSVLVLVADGEYRYPEMPARIVLEKSVNRGKLKRSLRREATSLRAHCTTAKPQCSLPRRVWAERNPGIAAGVLRRMERRKRKRGEKD